MNDFRPPRIRDVALAAGVSTSAVSRYLNRQLVLSVEAGRRVDDAVAALGYRPNANARRLIHGTSETIGLVTADIAYPFFAAVASAAEAEAAQLGYNLSIFNTRNQLSSELYFLAKLEERQVDGLLFMTNHPDDGTLRSKIDRCRHVVLLDEDVAGTNVTKLFIENKKGAWLATRHLIEAGHSRIAFVSGPPALLSGRERYAGFLEAMTEAGFAVDPALVYTGPYSEELGIDAFAKFRSQTAPPTAVFACADMLAIGVLRGARAQGLAVPRDLSIVGFDDILHANLIDPPLTTVRQPAADFGRIGIQLLIDGLLGKDIPAMTDPLPAELVVRGSVAPPRQSRRKTSKAGRTVGSRTTHLEGV
jgi:LacI family transcriptional regulator